MTNKRRPRQRRSGAPAQLFLSADAGNALERHLASGAMRRWADGLTAFLAEHPTWQGRLSAGPPVYLLPEQVAVALNQAATSGQTAVAGRTVIPPACVGAELQFRQTCQRFSPGIIGVWEARPVDFPLLAAESARPPLSVENLNRMQGAAGHHPRSLQLQADALERRLALTRRQLLGYAGLLAFDPGYRAERAALRNRWEQSGWRASFPLRGGALRTTLPDTPLREPLGGAAQAFLADLLRFLEKWQLAELVSWDLPLPQGNVTDIPLSLAARLVGEAHLIDCTPTYLNPPSEVELRAQLQSRQVQQAETAGIAQPHPVAAILGRGESPSGHELALRMWLVEHAVRSRYGSARGLVARLLPALAGEFGVSEDRVRQVRRLYQCWIAAP